MSFLKDRMCYSGSGFFFCNGVTFALAKDQRIITKKLMMAAKDLTFLMIFAEIA